MVCAGTGCVSNRSLEVRRALEREIKERGLESEVQIVTTGCNGFCGAGPIMVVRPDGIFYQQLSPENIPHVVEEHILKGRPVKELMYLPPEAAAPVPKMSDIPFFSRQRLVALRNRGLIDPEKIDEYIARDGYTALGKALTQMTPEQIIAEIKLAGLRGRGGAGFATGVKWERLRQAEGEPKYIICNGDEGDPGAFMDRSIFESDPHAVLEGMLIGARATGARYGVVYIRNEYPLALQRILIAIEQAREYGLLGENILDSGMDFDISVTRGAGAFVCGEETALIASVEGRLGDPRARPPYPVEQGLWGKPTCINNVETWVNVPAIISRGAAWYREIGTDTSKGTKVFSLVGKINNTGLVEVPMGITLRELIYEIGGGIPGGKRFKAVQTGGPSGGCIPAGMMEQPIEYRSGDQRRAAGDYLDLPIDYESLTEVGSMMGSGGMVVMDEDTCMVDVARYFLGFTQDESCGACTPCREGTRLMLNILTKISKGQGTMDDLRVLEEIAWIVKQTSLCGLGKTAPNPVLTTLRYFREEFEDHIRARRCPAGVCEALALSPCENSCPLHMNVPRFLELYKEGRLEEAFESVVIDNPLPASTGRVCQHPCEDRCRRTETDEPVNMRDVHRHIADSILESDRFDKMAARIAARRLPPTGKKVAVVGAGPAGLTCAYYLALLGHKVMVYDSNAAAGGMLRYALPQYRLPGRILAREIELIRRVGVEFTFNTRIGRDLTLDELEARHNAVFLAIGTWKEAGVRVPGAELKGVIPALPFLEAVAKQEPAPLGRKVVVIGGGNAAIDSARTALRSGAKVTIIYRRERKDMPAIPEETEAAEVEGVEFLFLHAPQRIVGNGDGSVQAIEVVKMRLGEYDASGRRRPVPTEELKRFDCETVILAIGEAVDVDFTRASGLPVKDSGAVEVNRYTLETGRGAFYAGGDVVTGPANVCTAMGYGKRAARNIDERLMGAGRWDRLFPKLDYSMTPPLQPSESRRARVTKRPPEESVRTFEEAAVGLTAVEAVEECRRCLRCDIREVEKGAGHDQAHH
jgi:NADH-quinone oxidoreductase subunit F